MTLTTWPVLAGCAAAAVVAVLLVPWTWDRRRPAARSALVLLATVATLCAVGAGINARAGFFPTVASLTSGSGAQVAAGRDGVTASLGSAPDPAAVEAAALRREPGHGVLVQVQLAGRRSGISRSAAVYLPEAYFDPSAASVLFPAIEVLSGSPGNAPQVLDMLDLGRVLDTATAAHRMAPTVVVVPDTNGSPVRDRECVDAVGGPQDDTYLSADLQEFVSTHFRVRPAGAAWGVLGASTGGYCAVNLTLRHPEAYAAAASLSGYFTALTDVTTGNLFGPDPARRQANDPTWRVTHLPQPPAHLWLSAGTAEPGPLQDLRRFAPLLHAPLDTTTVLVPGGGHNFASWRVVLPQALGWLSAQLPAGVAPTPGLGPAA